MKLAINLTTKTIVDILPDNATTNHKFLLNNDYRLLELENPYNEDGTFIELTNEHLKPFMMETANHEFESAVEALIAGIPKDEQMTWTKQEEQARAYLKDSAAITPLLDKILEQRTKFTSKTELAEKIVEKADMYESAVGELIGKRQAIEDSI